MGRRKVEVALLPTARGRQATFHKRKSGLIKKIRQLAILTGAQVHLQLKFGKRITCIGSPLPHELGLKEQNLTVEDESSRVSPAAGSACSSSDCPTPPLPSPVAPQPIEIFYTQAPQDFQLYSYDQQTQLIPQATPSTELPPFYEIWSNGESVLPIYTNTPNFTPPMDRNSFLYFDNQIKQNNTSNMWIK